MRHKKKKAWQPRSLEAVDMEVGELLAEEVVLEAGPLEVDMECGELLAEEVVLEAGASGGGGRASGGGGRASTWKTYFASLNTKHTQRHEHTHTHKHTHTFKHAVAA